MFWFADDNAPVFAGPRYDGQLGRFRIASVRQDGLADRFLRYTGLLSVMAPDKDTGASGSPQTVFGGINDRGMQRKFTIYLDDLSGQPPVPPPAPPPAPPGPTFPGYALDVPRIGFDDQNLRDAYLSRNRPANRVTNRLDSLNSGLGNRLGRYATS